MSKTNHTGNYSPNAGDNASAPDERDEANTALDIERRVLGSLMTDPACAALAPRLRASFFDGSHAEVAQAILDLVAQHGVAEAAMVAELLRDRKQMDADRSAYVEQLHLAPDETGLASVYAPMWADKVIERAQQRDMEAAAATYHAAVMNKVPNALAAHTARLEEIAAYIPSADTSPFWDIDDIFEQPDPEWNLAGIAQAASTVAIIADGGSGKTWLAQDWCLTSATANATHATWLGRNVRGGHVFFLAGEGRGDAKMRIRGWLNTHHVDKEAVMPYFHFLPAAVPLLDSAQIDKLIANMRTLAKDEPITFVVFDTLSKSFAGGDENTSKDVSAAIRNADRIKEATDATVCILHHTGKNGDIRGSSALRDDCDTAIMLKRTEQGDEVMMHCDKQRGAMEFDDLPFCLKKCLADEGGLLTTRIIVGSDGAAFIADTRLTDNQRAVLMALPATETSISFTDLLTTANLKKSSFIAAANSLSNKKLLVKLETGSYAITPKGEDFRYTLVQNRSNVPTWTGGDSGTSRYTPSIEGVPHVPTVDQRDAPYQVASTAPIFETPHSEPTYQPDVARPPTFPSPVTPYRPTSEYTARIQAKQKAGMSYIEAVRTVEQENRDALAQLQQKGA